MIKLVTIGLIVLAAVALAIWTLILKGKQDYLNRFSVRLQEKDAKLTEHLNLLTAERKTLEENYREIAPWLNGTAVKMESSYVVTEADEMKYNTDHAIMSAARKRLASTIAGDIIKQFPEPAVDTKEGRKIFSYRLKVMEDK